MASSQTDPPEDVPEELIAVLQNSVDSQLREITNYAHRLLREHLPITDAVESRHGEELVRVEDHGAYTIAIVVRPDESGEARGPFAYRVKWESNIEDDGADTSGSIFGKSMMIRGPK
jgi:hypothetical protein